MMARASWKALLYLRVAQTRNYFRTLVRQPGFWAMLGGAGAGMTVVRALRGGEGGGDRTAFAAALPEPFPIEVAVGVIAWLAIFWGLWQGTRKAPFEIRESDAVLLLPSPMSSRAFFALYLAVDNVRRLWAAAWLIGLSLIVLPVDPRVDEFSFPWAYLGYFVASLLGRSFAFAEWSWLQALEGREPGRAVRLRRGLRFGLIGVALVVAVWLAAGVMSGPRSVGQNVEQAAVGRWVERLDGLTSLPPTSWVRSMVAGGGSTGSAAVGSISERLWGGLAPALLLVGLAQAAAIRSATDYYEPLVHRAESLGNLARRASHREIDAQGVALEAFRSKTEWMVSLPPFGRGPGALLWSGLTRTVRFGIALATVSILTYFVLGIGLGAAVRWWGVSVYWAWVAPSLLAILTGSASNLVDELGRPYIFLFPGPPWRRLLAAVWVSVFDNVLNGTLFLALLAIVAPLTLSDSLAAFGMLVAAALLSQTAAGLGQIMLPSWIGGRERCCSLGRASSSRLPGYSSTT